MSICVNCGVELEDGLNICPLCGKNPGKNDEEKEKSTNYPSDIIHLHRKENLKHLWELAGIIAFSAIVTCTIVDLLISKGLRWSLYSDSAVLSAWLVLTLILYAYRRMIIIIPGMILTALAMLFVIDTIAPGRNWFFPVGFPVIIAASFAGGVILVLYKAAKFKGLNIIASALIILAGFCIITEMILDEYMKGSIALRWSLITGVSVLPVSLIFFFYHYRLKKGNRLDSFFHI
jgi:hypothetical protein